MNTVSETHIDHQKYIEEGFRKGNEKIIRELYQIYTPQVIKWIIKNQGTQRDAEEIFQESMYALVNKSNDPDFVLTCPIGAFLFSIWYNKWMQTLAKKRRFQKVDVTAIDHYHDNEQAKALADEALTSLACFKLLDHTFKQLSELCQKLLLLVKQGKSVKEMVRQLRMEKDNTFYRRKNACIKRWRELMEIEPEFEDCKALF